MGRFFRLAFVRFQGKVGHRPRGERLLGFNTIDPKGHPMRYLLIALALTFMLAPTDAKGVAAGGGSSGGIDTVPVTVNYTLGHGTPKNGPPPISEVREGRPVTMFDYQIPVQNAPSTALAIEVIEWNRDGTVRKQFANSPPKANWYIQAQTSIPTPFGTTYTVSTPKNGHSSASNQARTHAISLAKITKGMNAGASQAGAPSFPPAAFSSEWPGTGKYEGMTHRVGVWLTPGQDPDDANAAFLTLLEAMMLKFPPPPPPTPGG